MEPMAKNPNSPWRNGIPPAPWASTASDNAERAEQRRQQREIMPDTRRRDKATERREAKLRSGFQR